MPPKFYPLPAKPITSNQNQNQNQNNISNNNNNRQQQQSSQLQSQQQPQLSQYSQLSSSQSIPSNISNSNPLSLPRSTFFSTPQPASPRPNSSTNSYSSTHQASSPRLPFGSINSGLNSTSRDLKDGPITPIEDTSNRKKALQLKNLRMNCDEINFGQGWKVYWRSWNGDALLNNQFESYITTRTTAPPPNKRTKPDDKTPHPQDSTSSPLASTSSPPTLCEKLHSLKSHSIKSDPVEMAKLHILQVKETLVKSNLDFGKIECFVENVSSKVIKPIVTSGAQSKGKEKESIDEGIEAGRTLWIFSIEKGTDQLIQEENLVLTALASFEFPGLSTPKSGSFSYTDLFPSHTSTRLGSLSASSFPSAILLSSSSISSTIPYQAFLTSLNRSLLASLLNNSSYKDFTAIQSKESIIFLPPVSEAFGTSGRRINPEAVKSSFKLSIQLNGITVESIVEDIALRSFPLNSTVPINSPILLAPLGIAATFIKVYPTSKARSTKVDTSLEEVENNWRSMLLGSGLSISPKEVWIQCRLTVPNSISTSTSLNTSTSSSLLDSAPIDTYLDVVWPSSLCILDGTLPQPLRSPNSSPPRSKSSELKGSEVDLLSPSRPLDTVARRRLADIIRKRGKNDISGLGERIKKRAEGVNEMMVEMEEEKERLEEREREEKAQALARSLAPPIINSNPLLPPIPSDSKTTTTTTSSTTLIGQPINIRTPISLGGSVTEGPSPADVFERNNHYSSFLPATPVNQPPLLGTPSTTTQVTELDHLYPSPPGDINSVNGGGGGGSSVISDSIMTTILDQPMENINNFATFDWGDDFAGGSGNGMRSGLPQDFDDGMMMGLTDDDFSFFDDPAPVLPTSLPPLNYGVGVGGIVVGNGNGLQSSGPSPNFVDHFSHLTGQTPFASAVSPTSPFGQHPSPHLPSPNMLGYSFDAPNALGLGGTPIQSNLETGSPFKTPKTPYSPFLELTDEPTSPVYTNFNTFNQKTSISLAGTPYYQNSSSSTFSKFRNAGGGSAFDPVQFGNSHIISDHKYDSRKGKFGLPSPESDSAMDNLNDFNSTSSTVVKQRSNSSTSLISNSLPIATWYSTVCDPRVTAASQLQKRTKINQNKHHSITKTSNKKSTNNLVRVRGWLRTETDSEGLGGEIESDEDGMEIDFETSQLELRRDSGFLFVDDTSTNDLGRNEGQSLGIALLLLGESFVSLTENSEDVNKKEGVIVQPTTKVMLVADNALEASTSLAADQISHNFAFRNKVVESILIRQSPSSPALVSTWAIHHVHERLQKSQIFSSMDTRSNTTLTEIIPPSIILRAQQSIVQTNPSACRFWKPMAFEPLAGSKDVSAFVLYEDGGMGLQSAVLSWLKNISNTYQGLRLGKHTPTSTSAINQGLASVPAGSLNYARVKTDCQGVCTQIAETARTSKHVVVYVLASPTLTPSASLSLSLAVTQLLKSRSAASSFSILVYLVPLPNISDPRSISGDNSTTTKLNQLAFSVYDQLLVSIQKIRAPVPETFPSSGTVPNTGPFSRSFQAPSITISPSRKTVVKFELSWPPASLEVMHRHRILHVGYTTFSIQNSSDGAEWIILSFIDEKGEIWKTVPKIIRPPIGEGGERVRIRAVWNIAKAVVDTADVEWRIIICKLGIMRKSELAAWDIILKDQLAASKRAFHVTVTCSDLAPPLSIILLPDESSLPTSPTTHIRRVSATEEGELPVVLTNTSTSTLKQLPNHFDTQPTFAAFTSSDLITIDSNSNFVAPMSTYIAHIPRFASLSHTSFSSLSSILSNPPSIASTSISIMGLHFLSAHHTKSSTLDITFDELVIDVRQSFVELATLGNLRWGTSGRIAWHLEAIGQVVELLKVVVE